MVRKSIALGGVVIAVGMAVSFLSVLLARSVRIAPSMPTAQINMPAPSFELKDTDGNTIRLADLRGGIVVLMFTDPRCSTSNAYSDRINQLVERYEDEPQVRFLAVSSRPNAGEQQHLRELRVLRRTLDQKFPTLIDADGKAAADFGVTVTPTFYVIGNYGILRYAGAFDDGTPEAAQQPSYVQLAIERALRGESPDVTETRAFGCPLQTR